MEDTPFICIYFSISGGEEESQQKSVNARNLIEEVRKTQIESERITNITELEKIIQDVRTDVLCLKNAIDREDKETSIYLTEQLDLKLHRIKAFNFIIERRTVIVHDHNEYQ